MGRVERDRADSLQAATREEISDAATEIVEHTMEQCSVFDTEAESRIPRFELKELNLGHVVGRGAFAVVRELNSMKLPCCGEAPRKSKWSLLNCFGGTADHAHPCHLLDHSDDHPSDSGTETESVGGFSARVHLFRERKKREYVVKQISDEIRVNGDKLQYLKALVDFELEAKFMSTLSHPNILTARGLSFVAPGARMPFLILDRLEAMPKKLQHWMRIDRQCKGVTGAIVGSKRKAESLLVERLVAAHNVADALDYLHKKNIIFRDLKPDNLGFDCDGQLKLYDFGLAKELREADKTKGGLYRLTGCTGAIRYMAPEVGLRKPYNLKADVYSWSMLMWFILELEPPLGMYTPQMFRDRVFKKGTRPAVMEHKWPKSLPNLLKKCWSAKIETRPDMATIKDVLSAELLPYNDLKLLPEDFLAEEVRAAVTVKVPKVKGHMCATESTTTSATAELSSH